MITSQEFVETSVAPLTARAAATCMFLVGPDLRQNTYVEGIEMLRSRLGRHDVRLGAAARPKVAARTIDAAARKSAGQMTTTPHSRKVSNG